MLVIGYVGQGCTNPGRQVARATKFCMVKPNFGPSAWILVHVNFLAPRNLGAPRVLENLWTLHVRQSM
jgi:hypothetical protein